MADIRFVICLVLTVSVGIGALTAVNEAERRLTAFREDTERAVKELVAARDRDVAAVNAANARLWTALTNDVPKGIAKNISQAVADRLGRCEDKAIESLDRRMKTMEERYGRRER